MAQTSRKRRPIKATLIRDTDYRIIQLRKALGVDMKQETRMAAIRMDMRRLDAGLLTFEK